MRRILSIALLLPLLLVACGDDTPRLDEEGQSLEGTLEADIPVSSPTFSIINILRATGSKVRVTGEADRPAMETEGKVFDVNNGVRLEVFEYSSPEALNAIKQKISADGTTVGGSTVEWGSPVHLYSTDKVILVYIGNDTDTRQSLATMLSSSEFAGTK